ncbi:MAG: glycosyltransferase [Microbacterium sp.]|jgi:glycosyltransferase involved in cell wall biosynthesis|uniref:glycosyltransferase n=1 Tax=Microbacterium sp. TaxID=51671 RepID=UPI002828E43D|nr:glycosyltransferase [Microbacterium sp.]MDR2322318.1 glycosyltransferase [Microbacterium sp.]
MSEAPDENQPTRLLLLTHEYPFDAGDAAFVRHEIEALAEVFTEVMIVSLKSPEAPQLPLPANVTYLGAVGVPTTPRAFRGMLSPSRALRALRVFSAEGRRSRAQLRSDLVATLSGAYFASHRSVRHAMRTERPITVYSYWGVDIAYVLPWLRHDAHRIAVRVHRYDLDERTAGYRPIRRSVLGKADVILSISDNGREYLLERAPFVAPENILVRRLGIPPQPSVLEQKNADRTVRLVSCSSTIERKRVDRILETAVELARRGRTIRWTHFGDGPLFEELRRQAEHAASETPGLTVQLAGRVTTATLMERYRVEHPTVFINLSTDEGIPVSAMEAACFGIPIVASDVGSTDELVGEDLGSGLLVGVDDDTQTIASAVERVLDSPSLFDSRRVWAERYNAIANSQAVASIVAGASA